MFQLSVQDIHPGEQAGNKEEAIRQVAAALVQAGNVAEGYVHVPRQRYCYSSRYDGHARSGAENRRAGVSVSAGRDLG